MVLPLLIPIFSLNIIVPNVIKFFSSNMINNKKHQAKFNQTLSINNNQKKTTLMKSLPLLEYSLKRKLHPKTHLQARINKFQANTPIKDSSKDPMMFLKNWVKNFFKDGQCYKNPVKVIFKLIKTAMCH